MSLHELAASIALIGIGIIGAAAVYVILTYTVLPVWWRRQDRRLEAERQRRVACMQRRIDALEPRR